MSEYPADIAEIIEGFSVNYMAPDPAEVRRDVANLILAERERCAKIASAIKFDAKEGANPRNVEVITKIVSDAGVRIARAIRGEA